MTHTPGDMVTITNFWSHHALFKTIDDLYTSDGLLAGSLCLIIARYDDVPGERLYFVLSGQKYGWLIYESVE